MPVPGIPDNSVIHSPPNVWLLIPCLNEGTHLAGLLGKASSFIHPEQIIVIDDGSSDQTAAIARQAKVNLLQHSINRGKGAALKSGIRYLADLYAEWAITIDGDGQHSPEFLPLFLETARQDKYDIVIGRRNIAGSSMPWDRRFSNMSTSLIVSAISGTRIHDSQCGYRLLRIATIRELNLKSERYELETELLLKAARRGARIGWVPIPTDYQGAASKINRFRDTLGFLKVIVGHFLDRG